MKNNFILFLLILYRIYMFMLRSINTIITTTLIHTYLFLLKLWRKSWSPPSN